MMMASHPSVQATKCSISPVLGECIYETPRLAPHLLLKGRIGCQPTWIVSTRSTFQTALIKPVLRGGLPLAASWTFPNLAHFQSRDYSLLLLPCSMEFWKKCVEGDRRFAVSMNIFL
jgi:hypothetical protein